METNLTDEYSFGSEVRTVIMYSPSIGLYNRCLRVISGGESVLSCASFANNFGKGDDLFPVAWQVSEEITPTQDLELSMLSA